MEADNPDVSEDANSITFTGATAQEVAKILIERFSNQHAKSENETKENSVDDNDNEGPKDGEKNKAGQVYNGDIKVWVSPDQYQNWQKLKANFAKRAEEQAELDKKKAAEQSNIDLSENILSGIGIAGIAIFTAGSALEGTPLLLSLLRQNEEDGAELEFSEHGAGQAAQRGFTKNIITKIIREGKAVKAMGRYGPQTRYTLGENTVIVNDKGQIITTFSSNAPSGNFIPF
jgi:hypothetical protein